MYPLNLSHKFQTQMQEGWNKNKMSDKNKAAASKGSLTTTHIILIVGFALLIVVGVVIAVLLLKKPEPEVEKHAGNYVINASNLEEIEQVMQEKHEKSVFTTHMSTEWSFPSGKEASTTAVVGNSPSNTYPFYFTVDVYKEGADEGLEVYKSSLIPVGSTIKSIKLDTPLPKGDYGAIVNYHMIDDAGEEVDSDLGFQITIHILS